MPPPPGWGRPPPGWGRPPPGYMHPPPGYMHPPRRQYVPSRENMEHYRDTGYKPSMKRGYPYPGCTQEDLDELLYATDCSRERFRHEIFRPISLDDATDKLERYLAHPAGPRTQAARDRLRKALNNPAWTVDLAYKAFYDLDKAFFGGIMRGKVKLRWKGTDKNLYKAIGSDFKETIGITELKHHQRVPVVDLTLNAKRMFLKPTEKPKRVELWETLLHEMVHAYFYLRCGPAEDIWEVIQGLDAGHGRHFDRACRAVNRCSTRSIGFGVGWDPPETL